MVDLLAKVYLNDHCYASAAAVPFIQVCTKFHHEDAIHEFLLKFVTICISMLMTMEKNGEEIQRKYAEQKALENDPDPKKKLLALPAPPSKKAAVPAKTRLTKDQKIAKQKEENNDVLRRLRKAQVVEIILKIQNLRVTEVNDQMRDMLLTTGKRFKELYGYFNKGYQAMLKWWGDPEQVMGAYIRAIEEREQREREE